MLTKWGKKFLPRLSTSSGGTFPLPLLESTPTSDAYAMFEALDIGGNTIYVSPFVRESTYNVDNYNSNNPYGVKFGNGTTPATDEDYNIEHAISVSVVLTGSDAVQYDVTNNQVICYPQYTITNNTSANIEITEICKFASVYTGPGIGQAISSSPTKYVLIDRTVLDAPFVIEANTSGVLRYEVKYPLAAD